MVIDIIKENNIDLEIHISTQASTLNYEAVDFWKKEGVSRVVLARELSKDEIKEIIDRTGMEIECFVHGAMCSSYSGRCVLSNYFTNKMLIGVVVLKYADGKCLYLIKIIMR